MGVTQVDPPSPKIFDAVVDAVVGNGVTVMVERVKEQGGRRK